MADNISLKTTQRGLNSCSNHDTNDHLGFLEGKASSNISSSRSIEERDIHGHASVDDDVEWDDEIGEEEENKLALGLIGCIWTERNINPTAFMNTIKSIWAPKFGLEISNIGKNVYQFQFHHWRAKRKVMDGQPWHFDHHAVILGELGDLEKPSAADLFFLPVWVRFYDVPFKGRNNGGECYYFRE